MRKKRILFIMPFPPPVHGASMVSRCISQIAELQETYRCDYVNLSPSRSLTEIGKCGFSKIGRLLGALGKTFWYVLTRRYDMVYLAITCHGGAFLKDSLFVFISKLFCKKILIHQHNKGMSGCAHRFPYKFLLPLAYRNTRVMLLSRHLYPDIAPVVAEEQICICPNGMPEKWDAGKSRVATEVPHILFLSNLIESKGCLDLLRACRLLKERGCVFKCDFVGAETKTITRTYFEQLVHELSLDDAVIYHGPKYGEQKEEFLQSAAVLAFPTYYSNETFGLVLLEAMQYRLPVVTTREGGIPDVVAYDETGLCCQAQHPESLADALEILLRDEKKRQEMGKKGYERFHQYFTQAHFERNFTQHIHDFVNQ